MKIKRKKGKNRSKAKPIIIDGIQFRSRIEGYFYSKCKELGLKVDYESETFEIHPAFYFESKKVRPITYTPDFIGDKIIVELKGAIINESFPLRFKLFKKYMVDNKINKKLYLLKNQKQVNEALEEIKTL